MPHLTSHAAHGLRAVALALLAFATLLLPAAPAAAGTPLTATRTLSDAQIGPGSTTRVTYALTNNGSVALDAVSFTDVMPTDVVLQTPAAAHTTCDEANLDAPDGGSTITFADGRLEPGQTCTVTALLTSSAVGGHDLPVLTVTHAGGPENVPVTPLTVTAAAPGITMQAVPSAIGIGQTSRITLTLDGTLHTATRSVNVEFTLPVHLSLPQAPNLIATCGIAGNVNLSQAERSPRLGLFNMPVGTGEICTISFDVVGDDEGDELMVTDSMTATGSPGGFAVALLDVEHRSFRIEALDRVVAPGQTARFRTTIENTSEASVTGGTFSLDAATPIPGATIVLPTQPDPPCGAGSTASGTGTLLIQQGTLSPQSTCVFEFGVAIPAAATLGPVTLTSSDLSGVRGPDPNGREGGPFTEEFTQVALVIGYGPQVAFQITDPAVPGGTASVEVTVTNTSPDHDATDLSFTAQFEGLASTFVAPTAACGGNMSQSSVGSGHQITLSGASILAGQNCTFTAAVPITREQTQSSVLVSSNDLVATLNGIVVPGTSTPATLQVLDAPRASISFTPSVTLAGGTPALDVTISPLPAFTDAALTINLNSVIPGMVATNLPLTDPCGAGSSVTGTNIITLADGSTSCTFRVQTEVPANATLRSYTFNTSTVASTVSGQNAVTQSARTQLIVAGLLLEKAYPAGSVLPGDEADVTYTLTNVTAGTAITALRFTDEIPAAGGPNPITVSSGALTNPCGAGSAFSTGLELTGGVLAPGGTCTFSMTLAVPQTATEEVASSSTTTPFFFAGGNVGLGQPASATLAIDFNPLLLGKSFTDDPVQPGSVVTVDYTIANTRTTETIESIAFTDDLAAALPGLTLLSDVGSVCGGAVTGAGTGQLSFAGGTVAPQTTCTITVQLQVPAGVSPGVNAIAATSAVTGTTVADAIPVTGTPASDTLRIASRVSATASLSGPAAAGGTTDLTLTVTHNGGQTLTGVGFTLDLDAVLTGLATTGAMPATPCGTTSSVTGGPVIQLAGAVMRPGDVCTFTVTLQVPASANPSTVTLQTSAVRDGGDQVGNAATVGLTIVPPPAFSLAVDPSTVTQGQTFQATWTINNTASALAATGLAFADTLPPEVAVATPSGSSTTCGGTLTAADGSQDVSLTGGAVPAGATCTVTVTVQAISVDVLTITSGPLTSSNGTSGAASAGLVIVAAPPTGSANDLTLTLVSDPVTTAPGGTADTVLLLTNGGPASAAPTLSVVLPDGVAATSFTGCTPLAGGGCSVSVMPAGTSAQITVTTSHPAEGVDDVLFSAGSAGGDANPADNSVTATVTVSPGGAIAGEGDDLIDAAIAISGERFGDQSFAGVTAHARWAVLARADLFADALAGSALTGEGPLLFTGGSALDSRTATELGRVLPDGGTVYLLGGPAALDPAVEEAVEALGLTTVRLDGESRVQTAISVAAEVRRLYGGTTAGIARAYGTDDNPTAAWADSVSAGGWAASTHTPILLTSTGSLHPDTAAWLSTNSTPSEMTVLGGTAAISEAVLTALPGATRVAGDERAGTAVAIARQLLEVEPVGARSYLLVNGFDEFGWGYGLLAAGLTADSGAPLLLTAESSAPDATVDEVVGCVDEPVLLRRLSPAAVLSDALLAELDAADAVACAAAEGADGTTADGAAAPGADDQDG